MQFRGRETGIACDDAEATLRGLMLTESAFIGTDAVSPTGCGKSKSDSGKKKKAKKSGSSKSSSKKKSKSKSKS